MYVYDVKTQKLQVRTPCKCCSRSQKRSIPGLRLRLTPLLAVIERVCEYHILSLLLLLLIYMTKHISHTCGRKLQARAIFVKKYSQPYVQAVSCNSSSSVFLNHYRALRSKQDVDSTRLGSENNAMKGAQPVSYTHLRAHETGRNLVCRLLLEKKK